GYTDEEMLEWKTEFDVVTTLREIGHQVSPIGVNDDLGVIRRSIEQWDPQIAFNLLEEFHGVGVYDQHVVSYLELKKLHYTGCNPRGLLLSHDKSLCKKILSFHRIRTPKFYVASRDRKQRHPKRFEFPLLVKSVSEDASLGISKASVVRSEEELNEQIQRVHEELSTDALVEDYIEGRELYVGVMGNRRLTVLPVWEMTFAKAPEGTPIIATSRIKWDLEYQKKLGVETHEAQDLDKKTTDKIHSVCRRVYKALSLSGYARMDLRLTPDNEVYVLEANPNPNLSFGEDFAESAEKAGISYDELLQKIISLGLNYQAEWRLV
ncbi:MAG: D-alanine--D-alanine ligase family protein, partial [Pirellulaceae bacterium]